MNLEKIEITILCLFSIIILLLSLSIILDSVLIGFFGFFVCGICGTLHIIRFGLEKDKC